MNHLLKKLDERLRIDDVRRIRVGIQRLVFPGEAALENVSEAD